MFKLLHLNPLNGFHKLQFLTVLCGRNISPYVEKFNTIDTVRRHFVFHTNRHFAFAAISHIEYQQIRSNNQELLKIPRTDHLLGQAKRGTTLATFGHFYKLQRNFHTSNLVFFKAAKVRNSANTEELTQKANTEKEVDYKYSSDKDSWTIDKM